MVDLQIRSSSAVNRNAQSMRRPSSNLRDRIIDALERLRYANDEFASATTNHGAARHSGIVRFLNQALAGLDELPHDFDAGTGAGYGSSVIVLDVDRQTEERYTLMAGSMLDIDGDHVSLASPIGKALQGAQVGDTVIAETPQRLRRLRVVDVRTLSDRIAEEVPRHVGLKQAG